jgi:hypothetical protein
MGFIWSLEQDISYISSQCHYGRSGVVIQTAVLPLHFIIRFRSDAQSPPSFESLKEFDTNCWFHSSKSVNGI